MENNLQRTLTDKDFYDTACRYFEYHAGQRMTMINFYLAIFGAALAGILSTIQGFPIAAVLLSVLLAFVTLLFLFIDRRNAFDVKQSQAVICQIEQDYGVDEMAEGASYEYGVFSNEDNFFKYVEQRKRKGYKEFMAARSMYRAIQKMKDEEMRKVKEKELKAKMEELLEGDTHVSEKELESAFSEKTIFGLGRCISFLYCGCFAANMITLGLAIFMLVKSFV